MNYNEWLENIDDGLQPDKSFDIIKRELEIGGRRSVLYFIDGFIKDEVYEKILEFLYKQTPEDIAKIADMKEFAKLKMPYVEVDCSYDTEFVKTAILSGPSVLLIDGINGALIIDTRTYPMRGIEEPQKDKSLRGSRDGFVETVPGRGTYVALQNRQALREEQYRRAEAKLLEAVEIAKGAGITEKELTGCLHELYGGGDA